MNRRSFIKVGSYAMVMLPSSYDSSSISVTLAEETHGTTTVLLTEHDREADFCFVEAFYWTTVNGQRLLLHKEATTPIGTGWATLVQFPLPLADIVFLRVKELKLLHDSQFGDQPK